LGPTGPGKYTCKFASYHSKSCHCLETVEPSRTLYCRSSSHKNPKAKCYSPQSSSNLTRKEKAFVNIRLQTIRVHYYHRQIIPRMMTAWQDSNTPNRESYDATRRPTFSALQHGEAGFLLGGAATRAAGSEVVAATLRVSELATVLLDLRYGAFLFFTPRLRGLWLG
jgi:hypothetical protein